MRFSVFSLHWFSLSIATKGSVERLRGSLEAAGSDAEHEAERDQQMRCKPPVNAGVPRVIYQTWFTDRLAPCVQAQQRAMMLNNPGFEHRIFDDDAMEAYVHANAGQRTAQAFDALTIGAQKADLWRYIVLYCNGGIYLDMDSNITRPLSELLRADDQVIVSREGSKAAQSGDLTQWMLIFRAGHPVLRAVINAAVDDILKQGPAHSHERVSVQTGPKAFTTAVQQHLRLGSRAVSSLSDGRHADIRIYGYDYSPWGVWKHECAKEKLFTRSSEIPGTTWARFGKLRLQTKRVARAGGGLRLMQCNTKITRTVFPEQAHVSLSLAVPPVCGHTDRQFVDLHWDWTPCASAACGEQNSTSESTRIDRQSQLSDLPAVALDSNALH